MKKLAIGLCIMALLSVALISGCTTTTNETAPSTQTPEVTCSSSSSFLNNNCIQTVRFDVMLDDATMTTPSAGNCVEGYKQLYGSYPSSWSSGSCKLISFDGWSDLVRFRITDSLTLNCECVVMK